MPIRVYKRVTNGRRNASVNLHAAVSYTHLTLPTKA